MMNTELNTIAEIKAAVEAGHDVRCMGGAYHVIRDSIGQWLIHCELNNDYIGLHGREGTKYENKLNGSDFYIAGAPDLYLCQWGAGYVDNTPMIVVRDWFNASRGYNATSLHDIDSLKPGETADLTDASGVHTVERLRTERIPVNEQHSKEIFTLAGLDWEEMETTPAIIVIYFANGSCYVEENKPNGRYRYCLTIANSSYGINSIVEAQAAIVEFAQSENMLDAKPKTGAVRFSFPDGTEFSGFAFGDTWNGWDVIHVNADTLQEIDDWIASYSDAGCADCGATASIDDIGTTCRQCGRGVIETDSGLQDLRDIEPDTDGLYDLNGFCTSIDTE